MKKLFTSPVFLVLALFLTLGQPASAQFLPGAGSSTKAKSGLDTLLEEARKDGSTVIVVKPGEKAKASESTMDSMRAERFLQARGTIENIVKSAGTIWAALKKTITEASPDGSF